MTDVSTDRVARLKAEGEVAKIEAEQLAETFDDSTGLSWLWALLFGPIYFAAHGFWGRAVLVLALNFVFIGFLIAPFLAYPAWKARATEKAEKMIALDRIKNNGAAA